MNSDKELLAALQGLFLPCYHERIYLVGGSVRDILLGKGSQDIDLAAALPAEVLKASGFYLVEGKSTLPIWFRYDAALGKIEATWLEDDAALHTDLQRRDFTINAIAMRLSGELLDPLNGQEDLAEGRLRACGDDAFRADPLRIFRAFRFEADGWRLTPETEALIRQDDWPAALKAIPVERFSRELLKALAAREPARFFQRMHDFGVGREWLPELFRMPQIPAGPLEHHPEGDLFSHSLQVLQWVAATCNDPLARFCAFFHDIGKLATDPALYPKHHGHAEAGFAPAQDFCNRLALPATYRKALAWTSRLHQQLNNWDELRDSTKIKVAEQAAKAGIAHILPVIAVADKPGTATPVDWERVLAVAAMNMEELGVEVDRLTAMPAENRAPFILQRRVELLLRLQS